MCGRGGGRGGLRRFPPTRGGIGYLWNALAAAAAADGCDYIYQARARPPPPAARGASGLPGASEAGPAGRREGGQGGDGGVGGGGDARRGRDEVET